MATVPNPTTITDRGKTYQAVFDITHKQHPIIVNMLGRVNRSSFAGHPAGTLILAKLNIETGIRELEPLVVRMATLTFERNESRPWNLFPFPGGGWRELLDHAGKPLREPADFGEIDGHAGTLDLVEVEGGEWERVVYLPWDI
jgi:hypothetical protein